MTSSWTVYESPLGPLTLVGGPAGLRALRFPGERSRPEDGDRSRLDDERSRPDDGDRDPRVLRAATTQLDEYFAGRLQRFELELDLVGTEFQLAVWRALTEIPYGETVSYGQLARMIGRADRVRAVGGANGRNPIAIIVPCHRVIGADGSLTGYGGGLHRKRALLDLEASVAGGQPPLFSHDALPVA